MQSSNTRKYVASLFITLAVFVMAFLASDYLNQRRVSEMRTIQDKISIDILSSETQFEFLGQVSCEKLDSDSTLSKDLNSMAAQLSYMEQNRGFDDPEVLTLKKYYSLLEIKDYVLLEKLSDKCSTKPIFILYFYSNKGDCPECEKTGYVLTRMREDYPELRIYSFDYNMDLGAVRTLTTIYNVQGSKLPAMLLDGKVYYGFQSTDDIERILPGLKDLRQTATSTPTSTPATTSPQRKAPASRI